MYEEVMYGSSWVSTSQETIELNSFSYSVPIKLNVSIHNVLARAKRIYLLWRKELVAGCTGGGWLGTSRLLLGAGKGLPFIPAPGASPRAPASAQLRRRDRQA